MSILVLLALLGDPMARADELIQQDKYKDAISVLKEAEREARRARDVDAYQALRARRVHAELLLRAWNKVQRDVLHLSVDPEDADANLKVGVFYCFHKRDFATGLPPLSNGADKALAAVAAQDLAMTLEPPSRYALAERWWETARKLRKEQAPAARERAIHWYAEAWPWLTPEQKAKALPKLALAQRNPRGRFTPTQAVQGWAYKQGEFTVGPSTEYAKEGARSMRIDAHPTKTVYWPLTGHLVPVTPGKAYEVSVWFRSEGTPKGDHLIVQVHTFDGKMALQKVLASKPDYPFWHRAHATFEAPKGAVKLSMKIGMPSTAGTLWLDEVSVREGGQEHCPHGSFER